jgi:hypothetical protein
MKVAIGVMIMLMTMGNVGAETINLLVEEDVEISDLQEDINDEPIPDYIEFLNNQEVTNIFIEGYNEVGISLDGHRYVLFIHDDKIHTISIDNTTTVDYSIETTIEEILWVWMKVNKGEFELVDAISFVRDKKLPLNVLFKLLRVLQNNDWIAFAG